MMSCNKQRRSVEVARFATLMAVVLAFMTAQGATNVPALFQPPARTGLGAANRQHTEGHTDEPNWPVFLDWADRYFNPNHSQPQPQ